MEMSLNPLGLGASRVIMGAHLRRQQVASHGFREQYFLGHVNLKGTMRNPSVSCGRPVHTDHTISLNCYSVNFMIIIRVKIF
jgi:hypothetical protein